MSAQAFAPASPVFSLFALGGGLEEGVSKRLERRQMLSIANEVVRFWQHIKCPLLLVLFSCGDVGEAKRRPHIHGRAAERI
jgi:hypothetical protein